MNSLLQSYELRGKQPVVSDFSRLLRHTIEKYRGPILYSKKTPGLRITDLISKHDSIDEYEHFEYETITGSNLNNSGGDIRISIETQDLFTHPSESHFLIEGRLTKANGTTYANADNVSLTNNALMYLFKNIK